MATALSEYLKANRPDPFQAVPQYFPDGDFLVYYLRDVPHFARRIDEFVTVYLDNDTRELVGCKIKGVRHMLKSAREWQVNVDHGSVRLGFFFCIAASSERSNRIREHDEALKRIADVSLPEDDLLTV